VVSLELGGHLLEEVENTDFLGRTAGQELGGASSRSDVAEGEAEEALLADLVDTEGDFAGEGSVHESDVDGVEGHGGLAVGEGGLGVVVRASSGDGQGRVRAEDELELGLLGVVLLLALPHSVEVGSSEHAREQAKRHEENSFHGQ